MARAARRMRATLTGASLLAVPLAVVFVCVQACTAATGADNGPCGCDAAAVTIGPDVYTRCDSAIASVRTTGPCSGYRLPEAGTVEMNDAAYEAILQMQPQADGECTVAITFANGFTSTTTFTITGQWEACRSDPHGCGEYLMLSTNEILIDFCGDAGLYGSMPSTSCNQGTFFDGGCPANHCPDGSSLSIAPIAGGVCCICEPTS